MAGEMLLMPSDSGQRPACGLNVYAFAEFIQGFFDR